MTAEHDYPVVDPDNVPETICFGNLNVAIGPSGLSTITFTHPRPKVGALFEKGEISNESVVRARIVTTTKNLVALREIVTNLLQEASDAAISQRCLLELGSRRVGEPLQPIYCAKNCDTAGLDLGTTGSMITQASAHDRI